MSALSEIAQDERWHGDQKSGTTDGGLAEMAEVRVERLRTSHREEQRRAGDGERHHGMRNKEASGERRGQSLITREFERLHLVLDQKKPSSPSGVKRSSIPSHPFPIDRRSLC